MRLLLTLIAHVLVTLARLARPGGPAAVVAESVEVKHQSLIMKRARQRAPNLTSWDPLALGVCTLLVSPRRLTKMADSSGTVREQGHEAVQLIMHGICQEFRV